MCTHRSGKPIKQVVANNWAVAHASAWKSVIKVDIVIQSFGSLTSSSITATLLLPCQVLRKGKFAMTVLQVQHERSVLVYCFSHRIPRNFHLINECMWENIKKVYAAKSSQVQKCSISTILHYSLLSSKTNSNYFFSHVTSCLLPQRIVLFSSTSNLLSIYFIPFFFLLLLLFKFILFHLILVLCLPLLQILLLIMSKHSK